ncbi:lipid-A-disaccharide synthase N-terminal domain-containing protein [Pontiella sulfatireligans]|uniref:Lipid A biosynthesis N-terminal domain-containing protein n=1 Tax=Pontiella sulfatireligans TaxID=2750658 RepID=A0A6C2UNT7_9BACT|nr:lipid-A-disaccharide synthase N-terminal domain-containing protein [Pontiella sulfatireligans]VGO20984.1 hypothetical protein SCARR_03053 [Pontiella sulfatireligans]
MIELLTDPWVLLGLLGQVMFSLRMLVQWWASEKAGNSIVPAQFWYLSILGALALFSYAVHRRDPVFILGQSFGLFIYSRNIALMFKYQKKLASLELKKAS